MKGQGRLIQARLIEIYQVFAKKKKVGYFSNSVLYLSLAPPLIKIGICLPRAGRRV